MIQAKIIKGEADLLYQLMESFDVSIRFEYPDSNPTKEKLK